MQWFTQDIFLGIIPQQVVLLLPPFLLTVAVLQFAVIRPLVALIEERDRRTSGARKEAADFEEKFQSSLGLFRRHMDDARTRAAAERQTIRVEIAARQEEILNGARAEAGTVLDGIRAEIAEASDQAQRDLSVTAPALAAELAARVLGREIIGLDPMRKEG